LDGMASLSASTGMGYLAGNSAGSSLLRTAGLLLEHHPSTSSQEQEQAPPQDLFFSGHLTNTIILDGLLDAYFTYYNPSYPVVHEKTFRQKYQDRHHIPPHSSWHAIFYIILAIGNWTLGHSSASKQCIYYSAARSRMSMQMLESGTLLTIQAFLLMGNYLQKQDRPNTASNLIGIAYRMALGLGLHREVPTKNELLFHERRRAVWWIVYCFDSGFSLTPGRPVMGSEFIETRLPRNIDDSACTLSSPLPPSTDHPTRYSAIIAQARLASINNTIHTTVISAAAAAFDIQTARSLAHQLETWRLSLPPYFFTSHDNIPAWFQGPRAIVLWKEQNLRMMLWWGSLRLASETEDVRNMCYYMAIESIQDITAFCLDYPDCLHRGLGWYASYFLFQATVVLGFYSGLGLPEKDGLGTVNRELWICRARECLAALSRRTEAARRCLGVLDRM
ncbi:hypothetical protein BO78DRAFT_274288, partial [Aspergillus sclerotiicarbonarius CBS 121057]